MGSPEAPQIKKYSARMVPSTRAGDTTNGKRKEFQRYDGETMNGRRPIRGLFSVQNIFGERKRGSGACGGRVEHVKIRGNKSFKKRENED